MADNPAKTIAVCGDLVWDTHIARLPFDPRGYFQPHLQTQLTNGHGGAWYLAKILRQSLEAAQVEAQVLEPHKVSHLEIEESRGSYGGVARGFSVWEWFDGKAKPAKVKVDKKGERHTRWTDGDAHPGTWRIREFLGCQEARWDDGKKAISCPALPGKLPRPDVLVIDDLGLGFVDHKECWPKCLSATLEAELPAHIVAKATPPFDRPLWRKLLAPPLVSRLTVVVAASALRDAGARLSRGFSWDQTIEQVQAELRPGGTLWPLRRCARVVVLFGRSGAAVFSRARRSPTERAEARVLRFERFVFDPQHLEDSWSDELPGKVFGTASVMTAAFAVHAALDKQPSSHFTVSRGLAAAREQHLMGGGRTERTLDPGAGDRPFASTPGEWSASTLDNGSPFRSAFPRELLDPPVLVQDKDVPPPEEQTLLTDALGLNSAFLTVAAEHIVRRGKDTPLRGVPRLQCGKYFTVDREEIERLNSVRNLVRDYRENRADARPLSLAVFGPPGAGKSFAIKELSEALFGQDRAILEFNLSQFEDLDALHQAFHEVRDKSVKQQVPFVFWDEFDSMRDGTPLGWLKEFLAPMQDAQFLSRGKPHPIGKCVFIFAGGTSATFEEFTLPIASHRPESDEESSRTDGAERDHFRTVKGPDFVSRLRGYVNIKGPNPAASRTDEVHVIRRALVLRSLIERYHPGILDPATKELAISPEVLDAFLRVGDGGTGRGYLHGTRSMEAIVSLSRLHGCRHFGPSELPPPEVISLHATPDFLEKVQGRNQFHFTTGDIEVLAAMKHGAWLREKESQGVVHGEERNDTATPPTHPLVLPFDRLPEWAKEANRLPARLTALRLASLGYLIRPADETTAARAKIDSLPLERLAHSEHRRWMREKLLQGCAWAEQTNDALLLHADICGFGHLNDKESQLDRVIIRAVLDFLKDKGLVLVKGIRRPNRGTKSSRKLADARRSNKARQKVTARRKAASPKSPRATRR